MNEMPLNPRDGWFAIHPARRPSKSDYSVTIQSPQRYNKSNWSMTMKRFLTALTFSTLAFTAACETVPYEERVKAFEDGVTARFVGKSVDELILAFGPPNSSYKLSDGRDVLQYEVDRTYTTGGGSYTSYQTATHTRQVRDKEGVVRNVEERQTIPVQTIEPIRTINQVCTRRFVVSQNNQVETFRWQGNSCF